MKKTILPFIVLIMALMIITPACKKSELELTWKELSGSGFYNSQDDTSGITLRGVVEMEISPIENDPIWATIWSWQYVVFEGDIIVLVVNDSNYYDVLGDITFSKSEESINYIWVTIQNQTPKAGDIFKGANPTTLMFTIQIMDNNNNYYELNKVVPFEFTRD